MNGLIVYIFELLSLNIDYIEGIQKATTNVSFQVIILFTSHLFLETKLKRLINFDKTIFQNTNILLSAVKRYKKIKFVIFLVLFIGLLFPFSDWNNFDNMGYVKHFIIAMSLIVGVTYSTYHYNFYFNQKHIMDRLLLLILSGLVIFNPVFLLPTLGMFFLLIGQFFHPLYNSWTDKKLTIETLTLLSTMVIIKAIGIPISLAALIIVLTAIIGYYYFCTAKGKVKIKWHKFNKLHNLLIATRHQNSWNYWLGKKRFKKLIAFTKALNNLFIYGTILLEFIIITKNIMQ